MGNFKLDAKELEGLMSVMNAKELKREIEFRVRKWNKANHISIASAGITAEVDEEDQNREDGLQCSMAKVKVNAVDQGVLMRDSASRVRDPDRIVPEPLVIAVQINGHVCRALLDTGALADFINARLADQLKLETV